MGNDAHDKAVEEGQRFYRDEDTGDFVMTEVYLRERGWCCGMGCRHCPYGHENVDKDE